MTRPPSPSVEPVTNWYARGNSLEHLTSRVPVLSNWWKRTAKAADTVRQRARLPQRVTQEQAAKRAKTVFVNREKTYPRTNTEASKTVPRQRPMVVWPGTPFGPKRQKSDDRSRIVFVLFPMDEWYRGAERILGNVQTDDGFPSGMDGIAGRDRAIGVFGCDVVRSARSVRRPLFGSSFSADFLHIFFIFLRVFDDFSVFFCIISPMDFR